MIEKNKTTAGADEKTASKAEYFSWINNTNEGSTEEQTLINLEYFKYLHDEYGMQLDIYAWDAGNLDGAGGTYETKDSKKLKIQYPDGYGNVGKMAKSIGAKMGVWCGPDGFGNTPEDEKSRYDLMVGLCKNHNFGLFKMDAVCGNIREEKLDIFIEMMKECRKYSPELILLNHRLDFGKAEKYATTFLFEGAETYVDVHLSNKNTAMHHRAFAFTRKNVPELKRLTEDHGVCISSCIDYFEDDMIIQAFGRCLILAPEIYGNPWLMRDDEQSRFAHIFNLHKQYSDILVNGILLDNNIVSRGDGKTRFIVTSNNSWETSELSINLNETIRLDKCDKVFVAVRHPYDKIIGEFSYNDTIKVPVLPFRALLLQVCDSNVKPCMYDCGAYETIKDNKIIKIINNPDRTPVLLGAAEKTDDTGDIETQIETAYFAVDNDSLEARSLKRSGETKISEVKKARDAFFNQKTYILRGCEGKYAFDNRDDTFFDGMSKICFDGMRIDGGCLRVDFGNIFDADEIIIEFFDPYKPDNKTISVQNIPSHGEISVDLKKRNCTKTVETEVVCRRKLPCVMFKVHNINDFDGNQVRAIYKISSPVRYFILPEPMDRIFKIALRKNEKEITLFNPKVNNLMPHISKMHFSDAMKTEVFVKAENYVKDDYLAVAINGNVGNEKAIAVIECDGVYYGCQDRASSYPSNTFECPVRRTDSNYTYYFTIPENMINKKITVRVLFFKSSHDSDVKVYLCPNNNEKSGEIVNI